MKMEIGNYHGNLTLHQVHSITLSTLHQVALPVHCFQNKLEFGIFIFVEGGKPEDLDKNPQSKDENPQQTQPSCDAN